MDNDQATARAIELWGPTAWAVFDSRHGVTAYHVGDGLYTYGDGATWEQAFVQVTDAENHD